MKKKHIVKISSFCYCKTCRMLDCQLALYPVSKTVFNTIIFPRRYFGADTLVSCATCGHLYYTVLVIWVWNTPKYK